MASVASVLAPHNLPFLGLLTLSALTPAIPHSTAPNMLWWGLAGAGIVLVVAVAAIGRWAHWPALALRAPLLTLPVIQLLRAADGNALSGFTPLVIGPILWAALFGTRRLVTEAVVGASLVLFLPLIVIGSPQYPTTTLRGLVLLFCTLTAVGFVVHHLVQKSRSETTAADTNAARFGAVFQHAPVGMALSAGPMTPNTCFAQVNHALCTILGRDEEALLRSPIGLLVHPDDLGTMIGQQREHHVHGPVVVRLRAGTHRTAWAAVTCSRLEHSTALDEWAWQLEDVTAKRDADSALLEVIDSERAAGERLRDIDRQRRELISSVSHDLRTPVTAALGYAELLADGSFGELSDQQQRTIDVVARGLNNLSQIINELTAISPELNWETAPLIEIEVADLVHEAVQMVAIEAAARHQQIAVSVAAGDFYVAGDEVRLSRALVNLLGNAVKFTPEGGRIGVDVGVADGHVSIAITDDGNGISPADQVRIFDRFYRAPREHDTAGSGLGLAIVKAIAGQHGGTIDLRSAPNEGATFTLRLPLSSAVSSKQASTGHNELAAS